MKKAISMLVFNNPIYIIGAIISAHMHRKFIEKYNLDIELILMIDELNYSKYNIQLSNFFDHIYQIEIKEINLNKEYLPLSKYDWLNYSINKWQILKFTQFDKILFLDSDVLPYDVSLYDIFEKPAPCFLSYGFSEQREATKNDFLDKTNLSDKDYVSISKDFKMRINASFILIEPNAKYYDLYWNKFIPICEGRNGYISNTFSGPDETTIVLFYLFYLKVKAYFVPYSYSVIPWDFKYKYDKNDIVRSIDFLSWIKPWCRMPFMQWPDEYIWYVVGKKITKKDNILRSLFIDILLEQIIKMLEYIEKNRYIRRPIYNMENIDHYRLKKVAKLSKKTNLLELEFDKKIRIIKYLEKIVNSSNKTVLDMSRLFDLIK